MIDRLTGKPLNSGVNGTTVPCVCGHRHHRKPVPRYDSKAALKGSRGWAYTSQCVYCACAEYKPQQDAETPPSDRGRSS